MKILMIAGDSDIFDETSEVHVRMKSYASVCDELHVVVLTNNYYASRSYKNLFLYPAMGNSIMRRVRAYRIVRSMANTMSFDVISAQSPDELGLIAYMSARAMGARLQLQVHTDIMSPWYRRSSMTAWIRYHIARVLLRRADCVRVVSERIARSLIHDLNLLPSSLTVLPIFIDTERFMRAKIIRSKDSRTLMSACAMIAVGRFVQKEKNFSMLIRAMVHVVTVCPSAVLVLVGDGPDKEYYQSLITVFNLEQHVFLEPWRNDLHLFYQSFDLLVLPSYIEGWGRVVIEAMASGLGVVMTDVGLAGEVVRDGINGRVIPVADQSALVTALVDICTHPEKKMQLAKAARETVSDIDPGGQEEYLAKWRRSFDCCCSSISTDHAQGA